MQMVQAFDGAMWNSVGVMSETCNEQMFKYMCGNTVVSIWADMLRDNGDCEIVVEVQCGGSVDEGAEELVVLKLAKWLCV